MRLLHLVPSLIACCTLTSALVAESLPSEPAPAQSQTQTSLSPELARLVALVALDDSSRAEQALRDLRDQRERAATAVPALADLVLTNPNLDANRRRRVVEILADIGGAAAAQPLISLLDDPMPYVRQRVVEELHQAGGEVAIAALNDLLDDADMEVRRQAARAAARQGDARVIAIITEWQGDRVVDFRRWAVELARELPESQRLDPLLTALTDSDGKVREYAADGLERLRFDSETEAALQQQVVTAVVAQLAVETYPGALGKLVSVLDRNGGLELASERLLALSTHDESRLRAASIRGLARSGHPEAATVLVAAAGDLDREVRRQVAEGLGRVGGEAALNPLLRLLQDSEKDVVRSAADSLGRIKQAEAVPALVERIAHEHRDVRREVVQALGDLQAAGALHELTEAARYDQDERVRGDALEAIRRIGGEQTVPALLNLLDHYASHDTNMADRVADSLRRATNQDFAADASQWREWWSSRQQSPAVAPSTDASQF